MSRNKADWGDYIVAAGALAAGIGILGWPGELSNGVRQGLGVCANVLIPSLFPFMALSGFLSLTGAARILSKPLKAVTTKIFKLPGELGALVLMSLIGGYPVGARNISLLLGRRKIDKATAERMMCFCVNPGPSFLITAVGVGMLMNKTAGIILFCSQSAATIIIGGIASRKATPPPCQAPEEDFSVAEAFVAAVSGASSAMLNICAFAVLFSGLLALVSASGLLAALTQLPGVNEALILAAVSGFFEVASGCVKASELGGTAAFLMVSAIASFGGLSVIFQIMGCFGGLPIRFGPFFLARLVHIPLAAALALPAYRLFCGTSSAFASCARPVAYTDPRTVFITVCLLCMCAIMSMWGEHNDPASG